MRHLKVKKIFQISIIMVAGFILVACELVKSKPDVVSIQKKTEKKVTVKKVISPDLDKLTLEEIHNLPAYKDCRNRLSKAEDTIEKRPVIQVNVKAIKSLSDEHNLLNMFYLEPLTEKYPWDDSIRSYKCPKKIEDVRISYLLKHGPAYVPWYNFTYYGDIKGIDTRIRSNPQGLIESRFGDEPPEITLHIDKIKIVSLSPSRSFSNEDMEFTLENIMFAGKNYVNFKLKNKSDNKLAIKKFRITLGSRDIQVDFKKDILRLDPGKSIIKKEVITEGNTSKWLINDSNKLVMLQARVVYQAGWSFKKLQDEEYIRLRDLGINKNLP